MTKIKETRTVLLSLLSEKSDDESAVSFVERLVRVNESTEPDNNENRAHLQELRVLYSRALSWIKGHPEKWHDGLEAALQQPRKPTTYRKGFDGITERRVTDNEGDTQVFKKDAKGEFLPVSSDEDQLSDTALLLQLVADGDYDRIESLGYRIKRADTDRFK